MQIDQKKRMSSSGAEKDRQKKIDAEQKDQRDAVNKEEELILALSGHATKSNKLSNMPQGDFVYALPKAGRVLLALILECLVGLERNASTERLHTELLQRNPLLSCINLSFMHLIVERYGKLQMLRNLTGEPSYLTDVKDLQFTIDVIWQYHKLRIQHSGEDEEERDNGWFRGRVQTTCIHMKAGLPCPMYT